MRGRIGKSVGMVVVGVSLAGCVVVTDPPRPARTPPPPPPPAATPAPAAAAPPPPAATAAPPPPPAVKPTPSAAPDGPHVTVGGKDFVTLKSAVAFGSGSNTAGSFPGFVYWIPDSTQTLPTLDNMTPAGVLFARGFDIKSGGYTQGFPGLDAGRNELFAIRYEVDFTVPSVGEYTFRLTSDDGARVSVDGMQVANNDGRHPAKDAVGRIRLASGTHHLKLEYFQGSGGVALGLAVTPPGGAEKPFATVM